MKSKLVVSCCLLIVSVLVLSSCTSDYQPKPKGYNRLELPKAEYQLLPDSLPYSFEYSKHAKLLRDIVDQRKALGRNFYPELKANIHITYKRVLGKEAILKELLNDAYNLTSKHQIKANAIDEVITVTPAERLR